MMFDYVLLACIVTVAYSTYCTNSDFDTYETCIKTAVPKLDKTQIETDSNACYTKFNCPVPVQNLNKTHHDRGNSSEEHSGEGKGKGKGKGKEGPWSHVNRTVLRQCEKQKRESIINLVQQCVQQNITGFNLTKYLEHKRGGHHGHHKGNWGHHSHERLNETVCQLRKNVSECRRNVIEQIFNKSKLCDAETSCKITTCDVNGTQQVICDCAKAVSQADRDLVKSTFKKCIGVDVTAENAPQPPVKDGKEKRNGKEGEQGKGKGKGKGKGHDNEFGMFCSHGPVQSACNAGEHRQGKNGQGNKKHH